MKRVIFLIGAITVVGCGPKIPIVGVDGNGQPQVIFENSESTTAQFAELSNSGEAAVLAAVENPAPVAPPKNSLKLHSVSVGIGFPVEAGFGPLTLGAEPKLRFVFSDREKPTLP